MVKIPILKGVYADQNAAFRASYPYNLEPEIIETGLSKGYLSNTPGIRTIGTGPGADRGAITWRDVCYRVMGSSFCQVDANGTVTVLATVPGTEPVTMDYSFDRLAVAAGGNLYYWDGSSFDQVTDPDLGTALTVLWLDGYFITTDGESIVVTELNDPFSVDPLKYGSAEEDPDPVLTLLKVRGELYALNRYTVQNLQNLGSTGFPFTNNPGGLIPKGPVGRWSAAYFLETFAFVGSGRNEALRVYVAGAGDAVAISTREIDTLLAGLSPEEQAAIEVESRVHNGEQRLYVHLPTVTMVYMHEASQAAGEPVWYYLASGAACDGAYPGRHFALAYGAWIVGATDGLIGVLDDSLETQFGDMAGWRFETAFLYNEGRGGIIKSLELMGLPGRAPFGVVPTCALSMTMDGQTWGQERFISMGAFGERRKRVQWRPKTRFSNYVGLRFRGANTAIASWATLEGDIEPLSV